MEGDLREFPLAEILQFVSLGSRSGVLDIIRRERVYGIVFTSGAITGLSADGWTLAQELRESGLLPAGDISSILASNSDTQELQRTVLNDGYLTDEEWAAFVERQVERLLYTLFDARDGKFRFRQGAIVTQSLLPVRVTADRAVLEGTRWSETWGRAAEVVPSRQSRFERSTQLPDAPIKITPTTWRVFVAMSEPGNLMQLAARSVLSEVAVVESLQSLITAGLVRRSDETA
ncbi:MAG: DUF4388 domain-containing protein [Thermomicrobiales bacterium]